VRVLSFEQRFSALDAHYDEPAIDTFAQELKAKFQGTLQDSLAYQHKVESNSEDEHFIDDTFGAEAEPVDAYATYKAKAIEAMRNNHNLLEELYKKGLPWGKVLGFLEGQLPTLIEERERNRVANNLVP